VTDWDYVSDLLVVGSGGGLCAAIVAAANGREALVIEKTEVVGGSTAMSGGVLWLPNNPLMQEEGVPDSFEEGIEYINAVVGDVGPASSTARRATYITEGANMVRFLRDLGMRFVRCEGYSDYYADVAGVPAGKARGRSIEPAPFDGNELGPWLPKLRTSFTGGIAILTGEAATVGLVRRSPKAVRIAARVATRTMAGRLRRQTLLTNGAALIGQALKVVISRSVPVWTETSLEDLIVEDGRVVGAVVRKKGRQMRVRARDGVVLAAGGFARNADMRKRYSMQPNAAEWTSANPGDTGEVLETAIAHGAATALMDDAWWIPSSMLPDGSPAMCISERTKPGSIMVDQAGNRFFNEAVSYMEAGQAMYKHGAVPSWLVLDARARRRYTFAFRPPGVTPKEWLTSGYMKKADTLEDLALQCGIDAAGLARTVERFNGFARAGVDPDFHRGEGAHEKYQGDITNKPNACLGAIEKPPFYAVALYPGDVGTSGGLLCDEHSRVMSTGGDVIPGLYATGNCTASVMGRCYPGAGASIGASFVFAYVAAQHATGREAVAPAAAVAT
jgi:3-oxosteroid 1-dehydrogenase